ASGCEAHFLTPVGATDNISRRILAAVAFISAATALISRASKRRRTAIFLAQSALASRSLSSAEIPSIDPDDRPCLLIFAPTFQLPTRSDRRRPPLHSRLCVRSDSQEGSLSLVRRRGSVWNGIP